MTLRQFETEAILVILASAASLILYLGFAVLILIMYNINIHEDMIGILVLLTSFLIPYTILKAFQEHIIEE